MVGLGKKNIRSFVCLFVCFACLFVRLFVCLGYSLTLTIILDGFCTIFRSLFLFLSLFNRSVRANKGNIKKSKKKKNEPVGDRSRADAMNLHRLHSGLNPVGRGLALPVATAGRPCTRTKGILRSDYLASCFFPFPLFPFLGLSSFWPLLSSFSCPHVCICSWTLSLIKNRSRSKARYTVSLPQTAGIACPDSRMSNLSSVSLIRCCIVKGSGRSRFCRANEHVQSVTAPQFHAAQRAFRYRITVSS